MWPNPQFTENFIFFGSAWNEILSAKLKNSAIKLLCASFAVITLTWKVRSIFFTKDGIISRVNFVCWSYAFKCRKWRYLFRIKLKKILQDKKKISRNNLAANSIPKTDLNLLSEDKINFHCSACINLNFYTAGNYMFRVNNKNTRARF